MGHDVFLSYAKSDKQLADAVCAGLEARGARCWHAPRDIVHGTTWSGAIVEAIGAARVMVIILSSDSNSSNHVLNEVERAVHAKLHVIPFRVEDVQPSKDLELFLSSPHWLDALAPPVERHVEELARTVAMVLRRSDEAAADGSTLKPPNVAPARKAGRSPARGRGVAAAAAAFVLLLVAAPAGWWWMRGATATTD